MTTGERTPDDVATTRRMRRIAMLTTIIAIAPLTVIGVILTAESWWEGLIVAAGLLLFLSVLKEWSLDGYPRRVILVLLVTGSAWTVGAVTMTGPLGFAPFALVGSLVMARLQHHRLVLTIAFAVGVALIGALAMLLHPYSLSLAEGYILLPAAGTLFIAGVVEVSERSWMLVSRLERAKNAEGELAIAHERMRFAGDLHDIQGHTLHVIKLKAALAQRLVHVDPARAEHELDEIRDLVGQTIMKTRELAFAQHEIEFVAELENARRLSEAAGIAVDVEIVGETAAGAHPLLAHVLREATTNLLRHANPTRVSITASATSVEIVNDGAPDGSEFELRGLARLRERIELAGGELHVVRSPGRFAVSAALEPQGLAP